jgi:hypothetical protein
MDATFSKADVVTEIHERHWLTNIIANSICKVFVICPSPMNRKLVVEKVLSFTHVNANTPYYMLSTKLALVQQEVLAWVNQSLGKVKQANSNAKLTTKHCILATNISARPTSSTRDIARVLGVHHYNVSNAMERPKVFSDYGAML